MQWYSVCTEDRKGWTLKVSLFSLSNYTSEVFFLGKKIIFLLPLLEKSHVDTLVVGWQCELISFISSVVVYKATSNQLHASRTTGCKGAQTLDEGRIVMSQKWWEHSSWWQSSGSANKHGQFTLKGQMGSLNETAVQHEGERIYSSENVSKITFCRGLLGKQHKTHSVWSNGALTQHWYPLRWEREQNLTKLIDEHSPE